jgi:predicted SAM-dependent methyltransferase
MTTQCGKSLLKYPDRIMQECPVCGRVNPIYVQGLVRNPENFKMAMPVLDRGYSFCNCSNIFYTDWVNIDQRIYDENYQKHYQQEVITEAIRRYSRYFPMLKEFNSNIKVFGEIGSINQVLLDEAKKEGWGTIGIDINPNVKSEQHSIINWNVEEAIHLRGYDVIWASHIFEHFKDPLTVASNLYNSLNEKGLLFVAMPDPWFINWEHPHQWQHWVLREHHILWDMDSFIEKLENLGFKKVYHKRNIDPDFVCTGDYHLIFQK